MLKGEDKKRLVPPKRKYKKYYFVIEIL